MIHQYELTVEEGLLQNEEEGVYYRLSGSPLYHLLVMQVQWDDGGK